MAKKYANAFANFNYKLRRDGYPTVSYEEYIEAREANDLRRFRKMFTKDPKVIGIGHAKQILSKIPREQIEFIKKALDNGHSIRKIALSEEIDRGIVLAVKQHYHTLFG